MSIAMDIVLAIVVVGCVLLPMTGCRLSTEDSGKWGLLLYGAWIAALVTWVVLMEVT